MTGRQLGRRCPNGNGLRRAIGLLIFALAALAANPNAARAAACPNDGFRAGPAGQLPDCRAYEQATPVDKNGLNANGRPANLLQAASDGSAITFYLEGGLDGAEGGQDFQIYQARRGQDSWSSRGLLPPAVLGSVGKVQGQTEDGAYSFVGAKAGPGGVNPETLYERDNATGALQEIVGGISRSASVAASSDDGSIVAFETLTKLTENALNNRSNVYVWDRATGTIRLGDVLNTEAPPATNRGAVAGPYSWWEGKTTEGGAAAGFETQSQHVLSADGKRLFFTGASTNAAQVQLYMRQNPTQPQSPLNGAEECEDSNLACTVEVSAPEAGVVDPNGSKPAIFVGATPAGGSAFFMSPAKLTADATTGAADEGMDLYRFRPDAPAGERLTDLTPDPVDPAGAEVKGVLGFSADGAYVYFVAGAALPGSGAPSASCSGSGRSVSGTCNLYLWHEGDAAPTFIGQLEPEGNPAENVGDDALNWSPGPKVLSGSETARTARVGSSDGVLVFTSTAPLTGYDNTGPDCSSLKAESAEPGPCPELFRYAPGDSAPTCVSCNPDGSPPLDLATINPNVSALGVPGSSLSAVVRGISADGNRIFFASADRLVQADVNGLNGCPRELAPGMTQVVRRCQDVYEWEAAGTGTCSPITGRAGCLYLISTGTSPLPSYVVDNDASGANAFFFTSDRLVGQDRDELVDVYDAREGGGMAGQALAAVASCDGEDCKAPQSSAPVSPSPTTATFQGPENKRHVQHRKKHRKHRKKGKRKHGMAKSHQKSGKKHGKGQREHRKLKRQGRGRR